jgi:hypothetical protein
LDKHRILKNGIRGDFMQTFHFWKEAFIEDVNKENSKTIHIFGNITNYLFKILTWAGIPYMIYLFWTFSKM